MTNPIYIIGNNTLAYYLGAQIQSSGQNVILLTDKHSSGESLSTDGISIKEDRSLTQKRHKLNAAEIMKEPAKMVIITAFANKLNTMLSCVSRSRIGNTPVVCFTPIKDLSYLTPILGENLHAAYFNGYIINNKQTISLLGRGTSITLCPPKDKEADKDILDIFTESKLEINVSSNSLLSFWEYFSAYALCSILSAARDEKISDLLKEKDEKERINTLVEEFCSLAGVDDIVLNDKVILKNIYNTPVNYIYPLHQSIKNGGKDDFNLLSTVINDSAMITKQPIPKINYLLKKLYNNILNPIL